MVKGRIDDLDLFLLSIIAVYNLLGNYRLSHIVQAIVDRGCTDNGKDSFERLVRRRIDKLVKMGYLSKIPLQDGTEIRVTNKVSVEIYSENGNLTFLVGIILPNGDMVYYPIAIGIKNSDKNVNSNVKQ